MCLSIDISPKRNNLRMSQRNKVKFIRRNNLHTNTPRKSRNHNANHVKDVTEQVMLYNFLPASFLEKFIRGIGSIKKTIAIHPDIHHGKIMKHGNNVINARDDGFLNYHQQWKRCILWTWSYLICYPSQKVRNTYRQTTETDRSK